MVDVVAPGLNEDWRVPFERVVRHCTVHNTLLKPPELVVQVQPAAHVVA